MLCVSHPTRGRKARKVRQGGVGGWREGTLHGVGYWWKAFRLSSSAECESGFRRFQRRSPLFFHISLDIPRSLASFLN
ncbi:unnamed protein product [Chondrus crispus]|uniref:Uncharacterized protein n=1 Tax=Chondrus crispus TaxID=2769 RepID=R7QP15_CHOCR|nr:unnamed protein product [Chondrus crispus]CDF39839.1 unnamed protein product [Chondrus crispus]|eukprot:XP_005710133.1 unnamed protein product [Chondrus crispus]